MTSVGCVFAAACSVQYQQPDGNLKLQPYGTATRISEKVITRNIPYRDVNRVQFVVLVAESSDDTRGYRDFLKKALLSLGFAEVIDEVEFAQRIVDAGASRNVSDTYDLINLHNLAQNLGPFLVIRSGLYGTGDAAWRNVLSLIDPERPAILLEYDYWRYAYFSIDREFTYPTANLIREWYVASK